MLWFPGTQNSLDILCKKFNIDNSRREKHTALLDCQLLREVYINLIDQKEPELNLKNSIMTDKKFDDSFIKSNNNLRKVIKPSVQELDLHKKYLKSSLTKNFYS